MLLLSGVKVTTIFRYN